MIDNLNESLSKVFDVEPIIEEVKPIVQEIIDVPAISGNRTISANVKKPNSSEKDIKKAENDFKLARKTIKNILVKSEEALDGILAVAEGEGTARSYEVAANMMKSITEMSESLVNLHKIMKEVKPKIAEGNGTNGMNYIDKAVFVGDPSQLLDKIPGKNNV